MELAAVKNAISRKVDGVIICPCKKNRRAFDLLEQHGIPNVLQMHSAFIPELLSIYVRDVKAVFGGQQKRCPASCSLRTLGISY